MKVNLKMGRKKAMVDHLLYQVIILDISMKDTSLMIYLKVKVSTHGLIKINTLGSINKDNKME
jgi:hypothetical protein